MPLATEPGDEVRLFIRSQRGQRVILDSDLAMLYGVPTKRFNEAFKRNRDRFPTDFAFQLTRAEFAALNRSQIVTSSAQPTDDQVGAPNWSQSATSSRKHRGAAYRPWAFTEHGALMAANILRSSRARQMSIFVIRAFVRMREELATNAAILKRLAEIDRVLLVHDSALRDVYRRLRPLLVPPDPVPRREIGFHTRLPPAPKPDRRRTAGTGVGRRLSPPIGKLSGAGVPPSPRLRRTGKPAPSTGGARRISRVSGTCR